MSKLDKKLLRTAYHEAGHAVASVYSDIYIKRVSILSDEDSLGRVMHKKIAKKLAEGVELEDDTPKINHWIDKQVLIFLAGQEAEKRFSGRSNHRGAHHDYHQATDLATRRNSSIETTNAYLKWMGLKTEQFIKHRWPEIKYLAIKLYEQKEMNDSEVKKYLHDQIEESILHRRLVGRGDRVINQ